MMIYEVTATEPIMIMYSDSDYTNHKCIVFATQNSIQIPFQQALPVLDGVEPQLSDKFNDDSSAANCGIPQGRLSHETIFCFLAIIMVS